MIIGTRTLLATTKSGEERPVVVRLFAPAQTGADWDCRYEIDFPEDGWPAQTISGHFLSFDALQALQYAMQKIGVELYATSYHKAGKLRWHEAGAGYGFAVPKDARDLLIGDDAKFYG